METMEKESEIKDPLAKAINTIIAKFGGNRVRFDRVYTWLLDDKRREFEFTFGGHSYHISVDGQLRVCEILPNKVLRKNEYSNWIEGVLNGYARDDDGRLVPPGQPRPTRPAEVAPIAKDCEAKPVRMIKVRRWRNCKPADLVDGPVDGEVRLDGDGFFRPAIIRGYIHGENFPFVVDIKERDGLRLKSAMVPELEQVDQGGQP